MSLRANETHDPKDPDTHCILAFYARGDRSKLRCLHESFGTNGCMTEKQSAIARVQLKRMPE